MRINTYFNLTIKKHFKYQINKKKKVVEGFRNFAVWMFGPIPHPMDVTRDDPVVLKSFTLQLIQVI